MPHQTQNKKRNCSRYSVANLLTCQLFRSLAEFSLDLSALSYKLAIHFNIFVQLGLQAPLSNLIRRIHIDPIPSTLHIYLATKTGSFSPTTLNLEPNGTKTMQNAQGKKWKTCSLALNWNVLKILPLRLQVFHAAVAALSCHKNRAQAKGPWQWRS